MNLFFFFVIWQGIRDLGQTDEKDGGRVFNLLPPQPAVLPRSVLAVMELSQHFVSSFKTIRPIVPGGARCVGHVKIM